MRASDFDKAIKKKYQPKPVAIHYGGSNGNATPPDVQELLKRHVKTSKTGKQFISQYPDDWYYSTFKNYPDITDWDSFKKKLAPYWSFQRVWIPGN